MTDAYTFADIFSDRLILLYLNLKDHLLPGRDHSDKQEKNLPDTITKKFLYTLMIMAIIYVKPMVYYIQRKIMNHD